MRALEREGLVISDGLTFHEVRFGRRKILVQVNIRGHIQCTDDLLIDVDKWLEVDQRRNVRGVSYSYHAWLVAADRQVLRYDMSHGIDELHCHLFDMRSGQETAVIPVSLDRLPSLDAFIRIAVKMVRDAQGKAQ